MKKVVLAIGAHPDDIEIGCGGTLIQFIERGYEVIHLIITSGEEGNQIYSKSELARTRENEAKRSANILSSSQVIFLRKEDGLVSFCKSDKIQMISLIRSIRPEIVFTHAASDHFPDHQVVHRLTTSALMAAAGPWYPDADQPPHRVAKVYGFEVWHPIPRYQLSVDITRSMSRKIESLQAHKSQTVNVDYIGAVSGLAKYRGVTSFSGDYAEVFEIIKDTIL